MIGHKLDMNLYQMVAMTKIFEQKRKMSYNLGNQLTDEQYYVPVQQSKLW